MLQVKIGQKCYLTNSVNALLKRYNRNVKRKLNITRMLHVHVCHCLYSLFVYMFVVIQRLSIQV